MPNDLTYPDQILYLSFRMLYAQLRMGLVDRETAVCEKRKLIREYQCHQFREQVGQERVEIIRKTELARAAYRKSRTLENADKLVALIEGRKT